MKLNNKCWNYESNIIGTAFLVRLINVTMYLTIFKLYLLIKSVVVVQRFIKLGLP